MCEVIITKNPEASLPITINMREKDLHRLKSMCKAFVQSYSDDDLDKLMWKKELKLANLNKTNMPPASQGGHSEGQPVRSTAVTSEQLAAFKARGWSDKDIERYKKNLQRYSA